MKRTGLPCDTVENDVILPLKPRSRNAGILSSAVARADASARADSAARHATTLRTLRRKCLIRFRPNPHTDNRLSSNPSILNSVSLGENTVTTRTQRVGPNLLRSLCVRGRPVSIGPLTFPGDSIVNPPTLHYSITPTPHRHPRLTGFPSSPGSARWGRRRPGGWARLGLCSRSSRGCRT
jgi:hypothetical protein